MDFLIIIIYLLSIFIIKLAFSINGQIYVFADDYLHRIKVNDEFWLITIDNTGTNTTTYDFELNQGDRIDVIISNFKGIYSLACKIDWNGFTYTTEQYWYWTSNDTRGIKLYNYALDQWPAYTYSIGEEDEGDYSGLYYMFTFYLPYLSTCSDRPIQVILKDNTVSIDMSTLVQQKVVASDDKKRLGFVIKSDNNNIGEITYNGNTLIRDTQYEFGSITYKPIDTGKLDVITFYGQSNTNKSDTECTIQIFTCYFSCKTCTYQQKDADSTNMLCDSCNDGDIKIGTNCYPSPPEGQYYDESGVLHNCYESCKSCIKGIEGDNHNCDFCKDDYFHIFGNVTNCYGQPLEHYYLDITDNYFKPCGRYYLTCSQPENGDQMNCDTFDITNGFLPLEDNHSQCYDHLLDGYYYDPDNFPDLYKKCNIACATCNKSGTIIKTNCISCAVDYHSLSDDPTQCVSDKPDGYYQESNNLDVYFKCDDACGTCSIGGNITNTNCDICKIKYKNLEDDLTQCVETPPDGYYNDVNNQSTYLLCYSRCKTCSKRGDETEMNCDTCKDIFFIIEGNPTNSVSSVPNGYYYDKNNNIYRKCDSSCESCLTGPSSSKTNCEHCKSDYKYIEDDISQCVKEVPDGYYYDSNYPNEYKKCDLSCKTCNYIFINVISPIFDNHINPIFVFVSHTNIVEEIILCFEYIYSLITISSA